MATAVPMGIVSLKAEGAYAADKLYKKGMWVTSSGSSYAYINPTPSTDVPLTETTHWQQIASIGGQDLVDAAVAARDAAQGYKDAAAASAAQLAAGVASPADTYANLEALNAGTPTTPDVTKIYITLDDGQWCYWDGSSFVAGGAYQAASSLAPLTDSGDYFLNKNVESALQEVGENISGIKKPINLIDFENFEVGTINYLTGNNGPSSVEARSGFIPVENSKYTLTYIGYDHLKYIIFYNASKEYLGYKQVPVTGGVFVFDTAEFAGCKYVRLRMATGSFPIQPQYYATYTLTLGESEVPENYTPYNPITKLLKDYDESIANQRVFQQDNYSSITRQMSDVIKEIYIPDVAMKGKLKLSNILRDSSVYIRLYTTSPTTLEYYGNTTIEDSTGIRILELINNRSNSSAKAYVLIDWDLVPSDLSFTSKLSVEFIISDRAYDLGNSPIISEYINSRERYVGNNNSLKYDEVYADELYTQMMTLQRNFNVIQDDNSLYLSTDVDDYTRLTSESSDSQYIKALVPYLYFKGLKVGTMVLFDPDTGKPFIYKADGTKYIIAKEG